MTITELLDSKSLKAKAKTATLSQWLLLKSISMDDLIAVAQSSKDPLKAICIEAMEFATKSEPSVAGESCLLFASESLTAKAPRVKWESAKVIKNIARQFPAKLDKTVPYLLQNAHHEGTVVRWSAAHALSEILKLNPDQNKKLRSAIESICEREEDDGIRKIYANALERSKGL